MSNIASVAETGPPTREELEAALLASHDELLIELGTYGADVGPRDAIDKGIRVYRSLSRKLERQVCESPRVRELVQDHAEPLALAGAVADVIASEKHQVPVATLAALMVKSSLSQFCDSYWA